jgi:Xaa-Pro aminopeptidase
MATASTLTTAKNRLADLRREMRTRSLDAYVIAHLPSLRYFFGFSGSAGLAIVTNRKVHFFTNDLYEVQVRKELHTIDGLEVVIDRDSWGTIAKKGLARTWKTVGFDPTRHSVAAFKTMKKALSPAKLVETPSITESIIRVKSASEIKSIAEAARIASTAYEKLLTMLRPGMTEREVATFLASTTRELGSEKDAFDIIAVAGPRSAMPHGRASNATIKSGDVVTVDFGCCVNGLYSDMTRTFCVGNPSKKVMDVFAVLYDAHMAALDATVAGVSAADLDMAARSVIERAGYGDFFRHSLGHGLGYEVHELPRVSWANRHETIPAGTVITIEPGIYLPGKFGMRIEDDVVVTPNGPQILTTAPRELVIV